jgi:hypothetical protein
VGQGELREAEGAEERCFLGKIGVCARRKTVVEFSAHRGECEAELFERKVAELGFRAAPELLNKTKWMSAEDRAFDEKPMWIPALKAVAGEDRRAGRPCPRP